MALLGKAVLINWSNVAPEHRAFYDDWHNREHMPGRMALPGFRRGRRMAAMDADRDILNLYEVDDLGVLTGEAYSRKSASPSEAYQRAGKIITDAIRAIAHVRYSDGFAQGGMMLTVRFGVADEAQAERDLIERLMPSLLPMPDIVGSHLCVADPAASSVVTADRRSRPTAIPEWAIIVEATSREGLERVRQEHLGEASLDRLGFRRPYAFGFYAMQVAMSKDPPAAA